MDLNRDCILGFRWVSNYDARRIVCADASNKSLDASGISGLVIDNLSVTQLTAAASTQTLGRMKMFSYVP
jgi:hypothetical protein